MISQALRVSIFGVCVGEIKIFGLKLDLTGCWR
jgi:hypothetical protein